MTTIAWRGSILAADSALTCGTTLGAATKLLRMRGVAYGFAGDFAAIRQFIDAVSAGHDPLKIRIKGQFDCLMLRPEGCYLMQSNSYPILWEGEFWAIGTGSDYALGAMATGATAKRAVQIASIFDPNTAPPIQWAQVRQRRS
jgi:ATP-dependent protease HslVU (ClpYQ) peptidase subunit